MMLVPVSVSSSVNAFSLGTWQQRYDSFPFATVVFFLPEQTTILNKTKFICYIMIKKLNLRVRTFFHKTVQVCHVYCNFKIGFTCRITVIFGTLKDGSLLINNLTSNICFSHRNMFQNGVDALSKIVDAILSKSSKSYLVRIIR